MERALAGFKRTPKPVRREWCERCDRYMSTAACTVKCKLNAWRRRRYREAKHVAEPKG